MTVLCIPVLGWAKKKYQEFQCNYVHLLLRACPYLVIRQKFAEQFFAFDIQFIIRSKYEHRY